MTLFWVKTILSALLIAAISELYKTQSLVAGLLASLPLVSILAIVWLYVNTQNTQQVINLSHSIFWMVLPSLFFFLLLPFFLRRALPFYPALIIACLLTGGIYSLFLMIYERLGIKI